MNNDHKLHYQPGVAIDVERKMTNLKEHPDQHIEILTESIYHLACAINEIGKDVLRLKLQHEDEHLLQTLGPQRYRLLKEQQRQTSTTDH